MKQNFPPLHLRPLEITYIKTRPRRPRLNLSNPLDLRSDEKRYSCKISSPSPRDGRSLRQQKEAYGATLQSETLISKPWTCLESGRTRDETRVKVSAVAATVLMPFHHKIKTAAAPPSVLPGRLFSRVGGNSHHQSCKQPGGGIGDTLSSTIAQVEQDEVEDGLCPGDLVFIYLFISTLGR